MILIRLPSVQTGTFAEHGCEVLRFNNNTIPPVGHVGGVVKFNTSEHWLQFVGESSDPALNVGCFLVKLFRNNGGVRLVRIWARPGINVDLLLDLFGTDTVRGLS